MLHSSIFTSVNESGDLSWYKMLFKCKIVSLGWHLYCVLGTLNHMLWMYLCIQLSWDKVFYHISSIFHIVIVGILNLKRTIYIAYDFVDRKRMLMNCMNDCFPS